MIRLNKKGELTDDEIIDLMGFVNTIITHITNGNKSEERLVNIMGGTVIETASERLIRKGREAGKAEEIIEMGQEFGLDDAAILKRLQEKVGLSIETAAAYLSNMGSSLCRHMLEINLSSISLHYIHLRHLTEDCVAGSKMHGMWYR